MWSMLVLGTANSMLTKPMVVVMVVVAHHSGYLSRQEAISSLHLQLQITWSMLAHGMGSFTFIRLMVVKRLSVLLSGPPSRQRGSWTPRQPFLTALFTSVQRIIDSMHTKPMGV